MKSFRVRSVHKACNLSTNCRRFGKRTITAIIATASLRCFNAPAADRPWIGLGDANWADSGNWLLGMIPGDNDVADIVNNDALIRTIEYDYSGTAITLASLRLSNTGAGNTTFVLNANALSTTNATIGSGGIATVNQGDGTFAVNTYFSLVNGSYNLSGGQFSVSGQDYIGDHGTATFSQTGGTHSATISFGIGIGSIGNGTYNLQAGSLNTSSEDIGISGARGTLNQSGGDHFANTLRVGAFGTASIGIVNLSGGMLTASTVLLGGSGTTTAGVGILNTMGGVLNASNGISIYNTSIGTNASGLTISGGTVTTAFIATPNWSSLNFTAGTLNLTGGVSSNAGTLIISGSTNPTLNLMAGSMYSDYEIIGNGAGSSAVFNQTGGSKNTTVGTLVIGNNPGSVGIYYMSNSATLVVPSFEYVGKSGSGVFNQAGGSNASIFLYVGFGTANSGTYNLSNSATLSVSSTEVIGVTSTGVFNHTGGSNTTAHLVLGDSSGSSGAYNLSNPATLSVASDEFIGLSGSGVFSQMSGSNKSGELRLGVNPGSIGTYNLGNSATLSITNSEYVGFGGNGVFNQSGGRNSIANGYVFIGNSSGSTGTYNLSDSATLLVNGFEIIGLSGNGVFNQTGGNNFGGVVLGENAGSTGIYNLSGSATLGRVGYGARISVGVGGIGIFNQIGGTNYSELLRLGYYVGSVGTYNLSDSATLSVNNVEFIGAYGSGACADCGGTNTTGTGVFNQTGGSISGNSLIARAPGNVTLTQAANDVVNLAGSSTGGTFRYRDAMGVTVATVLDSTAANVIGLTTTNQDITVVGGAGNVAINAAVNAGAGIVRLENTTGNITQTAAITSGSLLANALGGSVSLGAVTNNVTTSLAGQARGANGSFRFLNAGALNVDAIAADAITTAGSGIVTNNGDVALQTGGTLTLNQAIKAANGAVNSAAGSGTTK